MPISRASVGLSELAAESLTTACMRRAAAAPDPRWRYQPSLLRTMRCDRHVSSRVVYELKTDDTSGDIVAITVLDIYGPGEP